ncbi:phosphomannomutase [Actinomycetes bacterium]|nr:phosphomannomutase [Actinomycetes bacterium]
MIDFAAAAAWLEIDPDPQTRRELEALIAHAKVGDEIAQQELADAFDGTLQFGTAGLRGPLGPGPNRMNRVVVIRAAAGLARYLNNLHPSGGAVVIGYDARHNSDVFAHDTASVLTGAGISAMVLPQPLPTPVLAFAIRYLGCAAGVMVTASHNPPRDNGYKVYLDAGSQIVPPADSDISALIAEVTALGDIAQLPQGDDWVTLGEDLLDAYVARTASLVAPTAPRDIKVVYTAMHGVGGVVVDRVMQAAGFSQPVPVAKQFTPDPDFPTVAFPNPEEPGAMDLALATAKASAADIVIANDPDADRCAVAVPAPTESSTDGWRKLQGDEVGALLAWWMIRRGTAPGVFAQSIVSCSLLKEIAESAGHEYQQTLTGFKWIARIPSLRFGYEEALGYCVDPDAVKDKDGVSAALLISEMAAQLKSEGRTVQNVLDELALAHGLYVTEQVSIRVDDLSIISNIMQRLRSETPTSVGGLAVTSFADFEQGVDGLPPADGLRFDLAFGSRIIVRPSGTEPKIKCYLQVVIPVTGGALDQARALARARLDAIGAAVRTWLA